MGHDVKRGAWMLVGLLAVWVLVALFFDPDLVDDSDLTLPEREVDPAQNPYPEIRELVWSESKGEQLVRVWGIVDGTEPSDPAFLEAMLKQYEEPLERFGRYAAMRE